MEGRMALRAIHEKAASAIENDEDIEPGPFWVSGSQTILRVGESLSSFWGYERLGTWGTDEAAEAAEVGAVPGEAKRSAEKKILGKGLPDITGSFINTFRYKNFDFTADIQFVAGEGDDHNSLFMIDGNNLLAASRYNQFIGNKLSLRLSATDPSGAEFTKILELMVVEVIKPLTQESGTMIMF
mgnify:CR=1 FL=1